MDVNLKDKVWSFYIGEDLIELLKESQDLINKVPQWGDKFKDYSFIVFPAAKAYEGFLKKLFLDLGFINQDDYYGKHFRIGKALNPAIRTHLAVGESIYDKLVDYCGGKELANELWEAWRQARNLLFHWFPDEKNTVSFEVAQAKVQMIIDAIDMAFRECKINYKKK